MSDQSRLFVDFNDIRDGDIVCGIFEDFVGNGPADELITVHDGDGGNQAEALVLEIKESQFVPGKFLVYAKMDWETWR